MRSLLLLFLFSLSFCSAWFWSKSEPSPEDRCSLCKETLARIKDALPKPGEEGGTDESLTNLLSNTCNEFVGQGPFVLSICHALEASLGEKLLPVMGDPTDFDVEQECKILKMCADPDKKDESLGEEDKTNKKNKPRRAKYHLW